MVQARTSSVSRGAPQRVGPDGDAKATLVLFLVFSYFAGGRLHRWISARPSRLAIIVAVALIVAGVFTFLYWDVRVLARREIIPWYPTAPWS